MFGLGMFGRATNQAVAAAYAGLLLKTRQTTAYHVGDDGDYEKGLAESYTVLSTGAQSLTTNVDVPHYAAATLAFVHGVKQIETATIVATITTAGNAKITVTAAGMGNSPKEIAVPVLLGDDAAAVAVAVRSVLTSDPDVSAFFTVAGAGADIILTAKVAAANDVSMNIASIDDTCAGITAAANSADTLAGNHTMKITDSANGLAIFKTADTIRVRGSALNDAVLTVATGNVAGEIVVTEDVVVEAASAYITICKRVAPSNNCVQDNVTGLMWLRYTTGGPVLRVGPVSDGKLNWYDATKCYVLHPAAADLQMTVTGLKIVGGAGEVARYWAGQVLDLTGFANAINNLPGYVVTTVAVNGADLDITLWKGTLTLIAEAAGGSRSITLVCQSIFSFCAAANAASLGGYTDWRIPVDVSLKSLCDMEQPSALPNATAFPSWSGADHYWSATTLPNITPYAMFMHFTYGYVNYSFKTNVYFLALVRG
jgi:hypothetical protein